MKYTTDEFHQRILYEYLAEASVVFPKVFPVVWVSEIQGEMLTLMFFREWNAIEIYRLRTL